MTPFVDEAKRLLRIASLPDLHDIAKPPRSWRECVFMPSNIEVLREKRPEILRLATQYGALNIRVFGSVARDEARSDSDVDFLVDVEAGRSLLDLGGLLMDLRDLLYCPVTW